MYVYIYMYTCTYTHFYIHIFRMLRSSIWQTPWQNGILCGVPRRKPIANHIHTHAHTHTCTLQYKSTRTHIGFWFVMPGPQLARRTQSIIYVPLQVIRSHKSILVIVQYKCLKSCSEDFILKNLILRTRSCGTAFITQHSWLLHFLQAEICLVQMICTIVVPASKGHLGGASP